MKSDILEQLRRIEFLSRRYYGHQGRRGECGDPHRGQGRILSMLKLQPEISQRELGYLLDMRKQSLAELLGKLETKQYITRQQSEEDRRVMQIRLTKLGAEAAESMSEEKTGREDFLTVLTDEEQKALSGYLERLIDELESKAGAGVDDQAGHSGPHRRDCPGHGSGRGSGHGKRGRRRDGGEHGRGCRRHED